MVQLGPLRVGLQLCRGFGTRPLPRLAEFGQLDMRRSVGQIAL